MEKPKKKRGRPKKSEQQQPDDGPSKPKRGRPRKKAAEPEVSSSEEDTEATEDNDEETGMSQSQHIVFTWAALHEKVPNVLSRCHTKRRTGARGRARPTFGMTPTF